jgi:hypothetical protein
LILSFFVFAVWLLGKIIIFIWEKSFKNIS